MLEYLEKLAEDREWPKVIEYAEQLLLRRENTSWDLMVVYTRLCQARFETDEFYGAQVAGELAMKMARELEAWDYFGTAALWLGVTHERLRQPEAALTAFYDYLACLSRYNYAKQFHAVVLTNIGLLHAGQGDFEQAISVLQRAAAEATLSQDHRNAHSIRLRLVKVYLDCGKLEEIPPLLVKCSHYLRHNPTALLHNRSLLSYLYFRGQFAVTTNRVDRAILVAKRGIRLAELPEAAESVFILHELLASLYERKGDQFAALGEAVRARTLAIEARRFDLEYRIADYLYRLISSYPDMVIPTEDDRKEKED